MASKSISVDLSEFQAALSKLDAAVAASVLETALKAGALLIQNRAKELAPFLTGTLRRSIHTETVEKAAGQVTVAVGTDVEYAAVVELGSEALNRRPRPYLRPAFDQEWQHAQEEIADVLRQSLQGAAR